MIKRIKWFFLLVFCCSVFIVINALWFKPLSIDWYFERIFIWAAFDEPEMLSSLRMLEPYGITFHQDELNDESDEKHQRRFRKLAADIEMLELYDADKLSESQRLSKAILLSYLKQQKDREPFQYHNYPVNQLFGVQNNFPSFMDSTHLVNNVEAAEDYITRLSKLDVKFSQVLGGLKKREELGILPPTFVVDRVLVEMQEFVDKPVDKNILYVSFENKLNDLVDLSENEKQVLLESAKREIETTVHQSYTLLIDYFTELRPKTNSDDGVWKFPDGEAFYNAMLRYHTTTNLSADDIHHLGLKEVDRIQGEITAILAQQGFDISEGFQAVMNTLHDDQQFYYEDSDQGRAQILRDYKKIIDEIDSGIAASFNVKPVVGVEVKRIPVFKEKSAPGAYYNPPSLDGARLGTFYANLYDIKATPRFNMRTLAYHEAIPGHHFQIAVQQSLKGVATFRRLVPFTAYMEGWALYAERLAWEAGYQKDPYDNIGRLQAELFRAVRLVVDTGIHHRRWSRQKAIDYMVANTAMAESDVIAEVERYIVYPGQATAYKVGMMKILEMRKRAQTALGKDFDLRDFHDVILKNGAMPLTILEQQVEEYIH